MILLASEEFAAKRRAAQTRIEDALRPVVEEAVDLETDTSGWDQLLDAVQDAYEVAYAEEAGEFGAHPLHSGWKGELLDTLRETTSPRTDATVEHITVWLATWVLSQATINAVADDPEDLLLEWVTMTDTAVRVAHAKTHGQQRPPGEPFDVDGIEMPYPGWPGAPIELWINCRCTLRPTLAPSEFAGGWGAPSETEYREIGPAERKRDAKEGRALPDGSFPIDNCSDLRNAIQAIGRAKDPAKAKRHIRRRKSALGCPEVELPDTWSLHTVKNPQVSEAYTAAVAATYAGTKIDDRFDDIPDLMTKRLRAEPLDEPTHAGVAVQAADSGRILMIQRKWDETDAPDVRGTWEFPGGKIEEMDSSPEEAAWREFCEETGLPKPEGEMTNGWRSEDGVYQGFLYTVPVEDNAFEKINPDEADIPDPDNPHRRHPDVTAWFTVDQALGMGRALRPECRKMDWSIFDQGNEEEPMTTEAAGRTFTIEPLQDVPEEARCIHSGCDKAPTKSVSTTDVQWWLMCCDEHAAEHEGEPVPEFATQVGTAEEYLRVSKTGEEIARVDTEDAEEPLPPEMGAIPWHGVMTVEGKPTGDGRGFRLGSMRRRPLPQPLTYQKQSAAGHDGNVVTALIEQLVRVPMEDGTTEIRGYGHVRNTPEADEMVGLMADFGRFGVSVDADDASFEIEEAAEEGGKDTIWFTDARHSSACVVAIPAFSEAWVALGEPEEGFMDGDELEEVRKSEDPIEEDLVAASPAPDTIFVDVAPGRTEDGPGWLTHPVDTDRLRDYWVRGPGAAKIGWGTPGDFNRCRALVAEYVKPQHINGYCANRHYDALGVWPGPGKRGHAADTVAAHLEETEMSEPLSLVASGGIKAPHEWFADPAFGATSDDDPRLVRQKDGNYGCPLTITEDGEVYAHLALWGSCHTAPAIPGTCTTPPESATDYAYFLLGEVLTDQGSVAVGSLTIGGGHAGPRLSLRQVMEHYDNTSTVFADVNCGQDAHGIWVHGWIRPGTPPEMVAAARASKLSGDWRLLGGNLELVAALSVNSPGFPVARIAAGVEAGQQVSLVAAGYVETAEPEPSGVLQFTPEAMEAFAETLALTLEARAKKREENKQQLAALAAEMGAE